MKKHIKTASVLIVSALLTGMVNGCSFFTQIDEQSSFSEVSAEESIEDSEKSSDDADESLNEESFSAESSSIAEETESEISEKEPADESSESLSVDESSTEEDSRKISYVSMTESEAAQASNEGYEFDDEQIVEDYHTAATFTDNDEFNEIFKDNAVDKDFQEELKNASSMREMMSVTSSYAAKWKEIESNVYQNFLDELDGGNKDKLVQSENEWSGGLGETENSFREEARDGGTEGLLAAETAIMNYYKGRTAKLLEQIYTQSGKIELSNYGL